MYDRKTYRVRIHGWENGELIVGVLTFESREEAFAFAEDKFTNYGHLVKVYNEFNELVQEFTKAAIDTYA